MIERPLALNSADAMPRRRQAAPRPACRWCCDGEGHRVDGV